MRRLGEFNPAISPAAAAANPEAGDIEDPLYGEACWLGLWLISEWLIAALHSAGKGIEGALVAWPLHSAPGSSSLQGAFDGNFSP